VGSRTRLVEIIRVHHRRSSISIAQYPFLFNFPERGNRSGHRFETQDVLVPWHLSEKHTSSAGTDAKPAGDAKAATSTAPSNDATPSSQTSGVVASHAAFDESKRALVLQRYCHVYQEGELPALFKPLNVSGHWRQVFLICAMPHFLIPSSRYFLCCRIGS